MQCTESQRGSLVLAVVLALTSTRCVGDRPAFAESPGGNAGSGSQPNSNGGARTSSASLTGGIGQSSIQNVQAGEAGKSVVASIGGSISSASSLSTTLAVGGITGSGGNVSSNGAVANGGSATRIPTQTGGVTQTGGSAQTGGVTQTSGTTQTGGTKSSSPAGGTSTGGACDPSAPFTSFENVTELNSTDDDESARLSKDQLKIYYTRRSSSMSYQVYTANRVVQAGAFGGETELLLYPDSSGPMLSGDGTRLYYATDAGKSSETPDLYVATTPPNFNGAASDELVQLNTKDLWDYSPYASVDDLELYFVRRASSDSPQYIMVAAKHNGVFSSPARISSIEVTDKSSCGPVISNDGLRLYFASDRSGSGFDVYVATRKTRSSTFDEPKPVTELNTAGFEQPDWISPDDCTLYFRSDRPSGKGGRDIWRASRR